MLRSPVAACAKQELMRTIDCAYKKLFMLLFCGEHGCVDVPEPAANFSIPTYRLKQPSRDTREDCKTTNPWRIEATLNLFPVSTPLIQVSVRIIIVKWTVIWMWTPYFIWSSKPEVSCLGTSLILRLGKEKERKEKSAWPVPASASNGCCHGGSCGSVWNFLNLLNKTTRHEK